MTFNPKFKNIIESSHELGCRGNLRLSLLLLCVITTAAFAQPNDAHFNVIAQGRDGNMYGSTPQTWTQGLGDVFKITPAGTVTVLHSFNGTDGSAPVGGLTLATDGKFYGTTTAGGGFGFGTIFRITAGGTLTTLYSFTGGADGSAPIAPPIEGLDGNFYGTASSFGNANNHGAVYKITPDGVFTTLHTFAGTDGSYPIATLMEAADGNLYGTASGYGETGCTLFRISASGKFDVLHTFDPNFGASFAPLIEGNDGSLYGNTSGAVFKLTLVGGTATILHTFTGCCGVGTNAVGGLVLATDGYFYGANIQTFFRVSSTGSFVTLQHFADQSQTTLLQHTNGVLYGEGINTLLLSFDVGLGPFVGFLPAAGVAGTTIEILGQGFTGTTDVSFNGTPAAFEVSSDTYLTATVPAGATTGSITVTGPSGTLTSNKIFRTTPQIIGPEPAVRLSTATWQFAAHAPGVESGPGYIFLTNTGKAPLLIAGVQIEGGNNSYSLTNECPATLGINNSCTLVVHFTPTQTGNIKGVLQASDNAPDSPQTVSLQGIGIGPAVHLSNATWDFGPNHPVGQLAGQGTVYATNVGPAPLHFSSISIGGADPLDYWVIGTTCAAAVAPYTTCSVTFGFTPAAAGRRTATLSFSDDAIPSLQSVALNGAGAQ